MCLVLFLHVLRGRTFSPSLAVFHLSCHLHLGKPKMAQQMPLTSQLRARSIIPPAGPGELFKLGLGSCLGIVQPNSTDGRGVRVSRKRSCGACVGSDTSLPEVAMRIRPPLAFSTATSYRHSACRCGPAYRSYCALIGNFSSHDTGPELGGPAPLGRVSGGKDERFLLFDLDVRCTSDFRLLGGASTNVPMPLDNSHLTTAHPEYGRNVAVCRFDLNLVTM